MVCAVDPHSLQRARILSEVRSSIRWLRSLTSLRGRLGVARVQIEVHSPQEFRVSTLDRRSVRLR